VVICLERDSFLHMVQLMPLPLTVSCFSKIQIGFIFLVPAHVGSPGQRAVKRCLLNDVFMLNFNTLVLGLYFIAMFLLSHSVMLVWYVLMCCCHVRVTSLSFTQMAKQRIMQTVSDSTYLAEVLMGSPHWVVKCGSCYSWQILTKNLLYVDDSMRSMHSFALGGIV